MTMGLLPSFQHIVNPKLKHIYLSFDDKGELVVKSPKLPFHEIEKILIKRAAWIQKTQAKLQHTKGRHSDILLHRKFYYLGECYPLTLQQQSKRGATLTIEDKKALLTYHTYDEAPLLKAVDTFYKRQTERIVTPLVTQWAKRMGFKPHSIKFRKTKRQWGSCSAKNILSFNTMLSKLPLSLIEYVVVHELAHIRHKHHQKAFWNEVASVMPDFQSRRDSFKAYTTY